MSQKPDAEVLLKLATEIAVAYVARNPLAREEVAALVRDIRWALEADLDSAGVSLASMGRAVEGEAAVRRSASDNGPRLVELKPAVPIEESVTDEYLVSLEDGGHYRTLRRHLMAKYGMTPDDYRRKWGLPADYPMAAPSYARERSDVAKRTGLGLKAEKPAPARRRLR